MEGFQSWDLCLDKTGERWVQKYVKNITFEKIVTYDMALKFLSHLPYLAACTKILTDTVVNVYANLYHSCTHFECATSERNTLIINISKTLLLGLPQKHNGCPIECIMLKTLISTSKRGLWNL